VGELVAAYSSWWFPHIPLATAAIFAGANLPWATFGSTWLALTAGVLATSPVQASRVPDLWWARR